MADETVRHGEVYIVKDSASLPSGNPITFTTPTPGSSTASIIKIHVTGEVKESLIENKPTDIQIPQTTGTSKSNPHKLKFMKKYNQVFTINGHIYAESTNNPSSQNSPIRGNFEVTRMQKRDSLTNLFLNGNNGKVYFLVIPKDLTAGTLDWDATKPCWNATSVYQFPNVMTSVDAPYSNGIKGRISKIEFSDKNTDLLNNRFGIMLTFQTAIDL